MKLVCGHVQYLYILIINLLLMKPYIYIETIGTALLEVCYSNTEEQQRW